MSTTRARPTDRIACANAEPDNAHLLAPLIRATAPRRLLEIATSNGYSTIWPADAAHAAGGSLTSVEIDPERASQAQANLRHAALLDLLP